jgi:ATP-binding cassette subfamily C protein LapB
MNVEAATSAQEIPGLFPSLTRLAMLQRKPVDRLALQEAVRLAQSGSTPEAVLKSIVRQLRLKPALWRDTPDLADLPALIVDAGGRWQVLRGKSASGEWIIDAHDPATNAWSESAQSELIGVRIANLSLSVPYDPGRSQVLRLVTDEILANRGLLIEAMVGGLLIALLGILTAFYTLHVYDRVIPNAAYQTLLVLTAGVMIGILLEYAAKRVRARLYDDLVSAVDQRLARSVYLRFLSVRLDQLPPSVGSLASQLRGYETVRSFLVGLSSHLLVDAPFGLLFGLIIALIAGPLALIPIAFFVMALVIGLMQMSKIRALTSRANAALNAKTGLLVESVEGAEIIKSVQGGWRMLNRWIASADATREADLDMRDVTERGQFLAAVLQQVSYVLMIAVGAYLTTKGQLTLGGLIACSILSGRVLAPVMQTVGQIMAWGRTRAALVGLDAIWALEDDHAGMEPVFVDSLKGAYRLERVNVVLRQRPALVIPQLGISAGERIGVLGAVGSGKTTLLRILSGLFKPQEGMVWIDDLDMARVSKALIAEQVGYLPQDARLVSGTLRDNLTLGMLDPGDERILEVARATGLHETVIATHPKGLEQEITEGGHGLSGGQRQIVHLTRLFLRRPRVWLLDEPTASLDRALEVKVLTALADILTPSDTLVLVTHKMELLALVERLVVLAAQRVALDGPKAAVLARLMANQQAQSAESGSSRAEAAS